MVLWEEKSLSVGELGERLYLDSGTLTPLLKKMEAKGFLVRTRSEADERKVIVSITKAGEALKQEAADIPLKMGSCVGLDQAEAKQLVHLLHKVLGNVRAADTECS